MQTDKGRGNHLSGAKLSINLTDLQCDLHACCHSNLNHSESSYHSRSIASVVAP